MFIQSTRIKMKDDLKFHNKKPRHVAVCKRKHDVTSHQPAHDTGESARQRVGTRLCLWRYQCTSKAGCPGQTGSTCLLYIPVQYHKTAVAQIPPTTAVRNIKHLPTLHYTNSHKNLLEPFKVISTKLRQAPKLNKDGRPMAANIPNPHADTPEPYAHQAEEIIDIIRNEWVCVCMLLTICDGCKTYGPWCAGGTCEQHDCGKPIHYNKFAIKAFLENS